MPNELDKLMDDRASDQKEFEDTFEDILGKTDEEIEESLKKAKEEEASGEAGDATKDQKNENSESNYSFGKDQIVVSDPAPIVPDTTDKESDWQKKAQDLESELTKEKQRTASWDGRIKAANEKTKKLEEQVATLLSDKSEKVAAKKTEQDMSDKEKMELFRENFPELADFADILQRKMDAYDVSNKAKVEPKVEESDTTDTTPTKTEPAKQEGPSDHYKAIVKVHPELDEIVNSGVLLSWINQQEEFIRPHLSKVYNRGSADEVISVVTEFKNKTGWKSQVGNLNPKQDKLNSMIEANGESPGPKADAPDKNDFNATAKEIGL